MYPNVKKIHQKKNSTLLLMYDKYNKIPTFHTISFISMTFQA